jgi:hypothetical protein
MKNVLFITHMYVSRFLVATLLAYVYLANANPSGEGRLEKNSPVFFSQELDVLDQVIDQEEEEDNYQDIRESIQE